VRKNVDDKQTVFPRAQKEERKESETGLIFVGANSSLDIGREQEDSK
jgi:hypothetical protein